MLRRVLGPVRLVPVKPQSGYGLLPGRDRPPGPRSAQGPGTRFDLVALVEAVGIEPTSESPRRQASTSIADYLLLSLLDPPIGGISERPAP